MRVILSVLLVGLFASCVSAQAYLIDPAPIYANASTVGPCGNPNDTMVTVVPSNLVNFGQLFVNYTTSGNQGGTTWCRFAFAETADQASFDNGIFFENSPCDNSAYYNLTAWYDSLTENGTETLVYLQFTWFDGVSAYWYSCGQVTLQPADITVTTLQNSMTVTETVSLHNYFKTPLPYGDFLAIEVTAPSSGSVNVLGAVDSFPNPENWMVSFTVPGEATYVNALMVTDSQNYTAFVTVFANQTSTQSLSIKTYSYDGYARYLDPAPQITDSLDAPGRKIYYTDSYSTPDVTKQIVVTATSGTPNLSVDQSVDGVNWGNYIMTGSGSVCEVLGSGAQNHYISVTSDSATSYTLSIENGNCNPSPNDGNTNFVSVFIVSVMFLVLLL